MSYTLAEPIYPEFPKQPQMPAEGPVGGWEVYQEAYDKYMDALIQAVTAQAADEAV